MTKLQRYESLSPTIPRPFHPSYSSARVDVRSSFLRIATEAGQTAIVTAEGLPPGFGIHVTHDCNAKHGRAASRSAFPSPRRGRVASRDSGEPGGERCHHGTGFRDARFPPRLACARHPPPAGEG